MRALPVILAGTVAFGLATTGIARADLWFNIKAPLHVGDTHTLPGQSCELMHRNAKEDVVRCGIPIVSTNRHVDTIGSGGVRCRIRFASNGEVSVDPACAISTINKNTWDIIQK